MLPKKRKTNISPSKLKMIKALHADGVGVREIARRTEISPTAVCVLLHISAEAIKHKRCPTCGMLIKDDVCRRCALLKQLEKNPNPEYPIDDDDEDDVEDEEDEDDDGELRLRLRPEEMERYWQVRPLAEARYAKMAEMREKLNLEHDAEERRNPYD